MEKKNRRQFFKLAGFAVLGTAIAKAQEQAQDQNAPLPPVDTNRVPVTVDGHHYIVQLGDGAIFVNRKDSPQDMAHVRFGFSKGTRGGWDNISFTGGRAPNFEAFNRGNDATGGVGLLVAQLPGKNIRANVHESDPRDPNAGELREFYGRVEPFRQAAAEAAWTAADPRRPNAQQWPPHYESLLHDLFVKKANEAHTPPAGNPPQPHLEREALETPRRQLFEKKLVL